MNALGKLIAAAILLAVGAFAGWLGSALMPPSPLAAVLAGGEGGGPGGAPGAGGDGMPPTPVLLGTASEEWFAETVRAVGTARAVESVTVRPQASGRLEAIHVAPGDQVSRGDVLFEVDSTEQRARLAEAEAAADDARRRLERNRGAGGAVPQAQIDQSAAEFAMAEAQVALARHALDNTRVTAPFDGTIGLVGPSRGAMVNQETALTTLDDRTAMKVSFTVPERFLGDLDVGSAVTVRSVAFDARDYRGEIHSLDGRVEEDTRSLRVEALIDNEDRSLRPGMFLTVTLDLNPRELIAVPEGGLMIQGGDAFVFIVDEDSTAHRRPVDILQRQDGRVAVRGEVAAGQRIIVAGQTRARDGGTVRPIDEDEADDGSSSDLQGDTPVEDEVSGEDLSGGQGDADPAERS